MSTNAEPERHWDDAEPPPRAVDGDQACPSPPQPGDSRLEIPEVLRTPVKRPASMQPQDSRSQWADTARAWGAATDFVVSVLAGAVGGWLFDQFVGTRPWGMLGGLALGLGMGFTRVIRYSQREAQRHRRGGAPAGREPGNQGPAE